LKAEVPRLPAATSPLQQLIDQLLAKEPEKRITDAGTLAQTLQDVMELPDISATPLNALWPQKPPETDNDASLIDVSQQSKHSKISKALMGTGIAAIGTIAAVGMIAWYLNNTPGINNNLPPSRIDNNKARETTETTQNITDERPSLGNPAPATTTPPWQETLANANRLFEQDQLITPEDSNALSLYREVLRQDSENIIAKNGEQNILQRLVLDVERLVLNQSLDQAGQQLEVLKGLWPEEQRLAQLQERITASRQRIEIQNQAAEEASKQREIDLQLQAATSAMIAGRLLKPQQESAHYHFNQVLALDPENQTAKTGLSRIADALIAQTESAISNNDFSLAESQLTDLRSIDSRHARLASLADEIEKAKANLAKKEMETQRLTEFQRQLDEQRQQEDKNPPRKPVMGGF
ncbi:MAG: hypothetical protein AB2531_14765, partial [Candidatus Thiodiazotropha sp.]